MPLPQVSGLCFWMLCRETDVIFGKTLDIFAVFRYNIKDIKIGFLP